MAGTARKSKYMFVGDSRMASVGQYLQKISKRKKVTVNGGTNDVVGEGKDGNYYYSAGGKDYNWFKSNVTAIAQQAKQQDCDYVVINMGVNDWPNFTTEAGAKRMADNYLNLAKQIEQQSGKKVVFVTPYPLHGNYERNRYNAHLDNSRAAINKGIQRFNNYIQQGAGAQEFGFVNIYDEVLKHIDDPSYWTDGVHGNNKLNSLIDSLWKEALAKMPIPARTQSAEQPIQTVVANENGAIRDGSSMALNYSLRAETDGGRSSAKGNSSSGGTGMPLQSEGAEALNQADDSGNIVDASSGQKSYSTDVLTAKQQNNMKNWAKRVGLQEDVVNQLIAKYGQNAYDLMLKAMMEPYFLGDHINAGRRSSKNTITMLIELDDESKIQKLYNAYHLSGDVNQSVGSSRQSVDNEENSPAESDNQRLSANVTTAVANMSGDTSVNYSDPKILNAIVDHVHNVRTATAKKCKLAIPSKSDTTKIVQTIIEKSQKYGIDPCLALAVAEKESGFLNNRKSYAGAQGIMQLMPATARGLGVNPRDPQQNIEGGIRLLSQNQRQYGGNYIHMLVAYNAGPGNLKKGMKAGLSGSSLDKKTDRKQYAHAVINTMDVYRGLVGENANVYASYFGNEPVDIWYPAKKSSTRTFAAATRKSRNSGRA